MTPNFHLPQPNGTSGASNEEDLADLNFADSEKEAEAPEPHSLAQSRQHLTNQGYPFHTTQVAL